MENKMFHVEIDPDTRVMTVAGVKYSFDIFNTLAFPQLDRLYSFVNEDGVLTVTTHGPAPVRESAALAPAQARPQQYERR